MRKKLMALWLAACCALCACGTGGPREEGGQPPEDASQTSGSEATDISQFLFPREDVDQVFVWMMGGVRGGANVGTSEEEKEAILDQLYDVDLSEFEDVDPGGTGGSAATFIIRSGDAEKTVMVGASEDSQYLRITDGQQELFQEGPAESFDYPALSDLVTEVLANKEDPDYSGRVEVVGKDHVSQVNKGNCAVAQGMMEQFIAQGGSAEEDASISYDIVLEVGDLVYGINSETGQFFKEEAGERTYAQLDENGLFTVKLRLGVSGATA